MMLYVDARPSVITDERLARMRDALVRYPGDDRVVVVVRRDKVQLPITVDASSRQLRRDVSEAFDGTLMVQAFTEEDAW